MRKLLVILLSPALFLNSCGPASDSGSNLVRDSSLIDSTAISLLQDPDTTDTIPASAYGINTYGSDTENQIRNSFQTLFKDDLAGNIIPDLSRKFIFFEYDLNGDSINEIFAGLTGPYFCGSGGCTIYVFNHDGTVLTRFTVADYPIVISDSKTMAFKDLIIQSNGQNHLVKFDGKKYPSNPSIEPVLKLIPGDGLPRALNFINEPYPWFRF
jgi:hypothetical protein